MASSYNGWEASKDPAAIDIDRDFTAAGRKFPGGVKRGPVSVVLRYLIEQFDKRVEEVDLYDPGDEWGYVYKPSANSPSKLSCHSSGTAVDINATRHPNRKRGTFTAAQVDAIHTILDELDGVVRWLGDTSGTPDEMHFEIKGTAAEVARVAGRILQPLLEKPAPIEEDDMTPDQAKQLAEVHKFTTEWGNSLNWRTLEQLQTMMIAVVAGDDPPDLVKDVDSFVETLAAKLGPVLAGKVGLSADEAKAAVLAALREGTG
jgi:hypothetical protein